jgi:putative transposase
MAMAPGIDDLLNRVYHTRDQARSEIFKYIELFYNRRRLYRSQVYQIPMKYELTSVAKQCQAFLL